MSAFHVVRNVQYRQPVTQQPPWGYRFGPENLLLKAQSHQRGGRGLETGESQTFKRSREGFSGCVSSAALQ